jgi:hypothetical protein
MPPTATAAHFVGMQFATPPFVEGIMAKDLFSFDDCDGGEKSCFEEYLLDVC